MGVNPEWFKGMSPEDAELFSAKLQNSKSVLLELHRLLRDRLKSKETMEVQLSSYEDHSWAFKQADIVGSKRELRNLLRLIESVTGPQ